MEEESRDSEKEFPGLYASEASHRSDSDYNDSTYEKGGKKELLKRQKKDKNKDKGYAALDAESSGEEMDYLDIKNPLKSRRPKSFKFLQKKDREEKEKEEKKEDKRKKEKDEKDDKKKEKKKEKEERKLREKEEKKKIKKEKKKKYGDENLCDESYSIFGVPLSIAIERNPSHDGIRLPAIVRECIDHVEEKGLSCEGIYRLGGMKSKVQTLRRMYNSGEIVHLEDQQPHVVASLLKQYLRELPETILTVDMMAHFEDVSLIPNPKERAEAMRQLIDRLPTTNRLLLQYVLKHMGHVIEREKETKMSYHNVCVVLSPTMQISHRVLNVMFHSHHFLFGNVHIKRYIPPIASHPGVQKSIEDLKTSPDIEEEIKKQESLLSFLHKVIAAGRISQSKEEQLWEAQRIVTLLKRKLKSVQRRETGGNQRSFSGSCPDKDLSSEESQKETAPCGPKKVSAKEGTNAASENDEEVDKSTSGCGDVKSGTGSETDTTGTPSFKTASNNEQFSRKSSEESDKSQASSTSVKRDDLKTEAPLKQTEASALPAKEQIIPILPKPFSAKAERSKLGFTSRDKNSSIDAAPSSRKRDDSTSQTAEYSSLPVFIESSSSRKAAPKTAINVDMSCKLKSDGKRLPFDKDVLQKVNKMSEIAEDKISHESTSVIHRLNPASADRVGKAIRNSDDERKAAISAGGNSEPPYSEDCDLGFLLRENSRLHLEHEELLSMNQELTRKLQAEKTEISRLRDEIQEMQTLYGYRTHSYDSSESEKSESEGESDNEEEIFKQILSIDKKNKQIKSENSSLTMRIQDERELIVRLKVALREAQIKPKTLPQQVVQAC